MNTRRIWFIYFPSWVKFPSSTFSREAIESTLVVGIECVSCCVGIYVVSEDFGSVEPANEKCLSTFINDYWFLGVRITSVLGSCGCAIRKGIDFYDFGMKTNK